MIIEYLAEALLKATKKKNGGKKMEVAKGTFFDSLKILCKFAGSNVEVWRLSIKSTDELDHICLGRILDLTFLVQDLSKDMEELRNMSHDETVVGSEEREDALKHRFVFFIISLKR